MSHLPGDVIRCDVPVPKCTSVRASFVIDTTHPQTGATGNHPDDGTAITEWGVDALDHNGYIAFGTPDAILYPGGSAGGDIKTGTTFRVDGDNEVPETTTLRFETSQSADVESFSLTDFQIQVKTSLLAVIRSATVQG